MKFWKKLNKKQKSFIFKLIKIGIIAGLIFVGGIALWATTLSLPNLDNFDERQVAQSTKILDRTGEIVLYDIHGDYKRTVVSFDEISEFAKQATIAIEDKDFYEHNGIQVSAIFRAILRNLAAGNLLGGQGGSTITQQVIKNALLTTDKKVSRKIKEWILAPRLEKALTKNQILEIYLNEVPYGGNVYGIEEASLRFFGKQAKDLNLPESAYLAALPQAPTYYSPYGNNTDQLNARKNHVLDQMHLVGYITERELEEAKNTAVTFQKQEEFGIKAPHFVVYVREQLEKEFGKDVIEEGGFRVVTTLNWELQSEAEEIVREYVLGNDNGFAGIEEIYDAENAALVAVDPQTGEILTMVGSRDYFDEDIDGNFNITTAERQPGSSFKPIVYAEAFNKGYLPETVVFDLPTEFSATCANGGNCYSPVNYDDTFRGPMSLRDALAKSINIPAIKVLYLAGLRDSLNLAKKMGIETLTNVDQYGLTLVLGGGEVRPLDMASAYSIFANEGIKHEQTTILRIESRDGEILYEKEEDNGERVLSEQTTRMINDILSNDVARSYGSNSPFSFGGLDVAAKTGTTNNYRDVWVVGYTPNISVATWAGNNDNTPINKQVAGLVISPMWRQFMDVALAKMDHGNFTAPTPNTSVTKPILTGFWKGEEVEFIKPEDSDDSDISDNENSSNSGQFAVTGSGGGIHSILHWVNRSDPLGPYPSNPYADPQYELWESSVRSWVQRQGISDDVEITDIDNVKKAYLEIITINHNGSYLRDNPLVVVVKMSDGRKIQSGEVYLNGESLGGLNTETRSYDFIPEEISNIQESNNTLQVTIRDELNNEFESVKSFDLVQ
jgi:1A family penicillin-binding protein